MATGPVALIRSSVFSLFLQFLEEIGAPCERYLDATHLSPSLFDQRDSLIALRQVLACADQAARREEIPHLGVAVGQRVGLGALMDIVQIVSRMPTLRAAINRLAETIGLISTAERISLRTHGDQAYLCHDLSLDRAAPSRQGDEFTLVLLIDLVRLAAGPHWRPTALRIPPLQAVHRRTYEALFQVPVLVGSDDWQVVFDAALLTRPLRYCQPSPVPGEAGAVERLQASAPATDFMNSLRQTIVSFLPRGSPHVGIAAEAAGLTIRTLQRRLQETGYSYSDLLEEVRLQQALRLLRETDAKLVDVALDLGYTDAANFSRAFRRWTGVTPQRVRMAGNQQDVHREP
jgi:AraC-type DNA-binding domain-containing proteins